MNLDVNVTQALLSIVGFLLVRASLDLRRLADSVEGLNVKMASVVTRTDSHEDRITRLENKGEMYGTEAR